MAEVCSDTTFKALIAECAGGNQDAANRLLTHRFTETKLNEAEIVRALNSPGFGYLVNFFPHGVWEDGQGQDELREVYFDPEVDLSFGIFIRSMQITDPTLADECRVCRYLLPTGGYGQMPGPKMFKWGWKTLPFCIPNFRHVRDFLKWARRIIDVRFKVDDRTMGMFYVMGALETTAHKYTLQARTNATSGALEKVPSAGPRNLLEGYLHNYLEDKFPAPTDPAKVVPLSLTDLRTLARRMTREMPEAAVATGPRGEKIFEFWDSRDFFKENVLDKAEYVDRQRWFMDGKDLPGYTLGSPKREVIENWRPMSMPALPRFALSRDGLRIIPVQQHMPLNDKGVITGYEYIAGPDFDNAPFLVYLMIDPQQAKILTRPVINKSVEGADILPIGSGQWRTRNEYDKECNPDRNMPWMEVDYQKGYQMMNYNGQAILARAAKYLTEPLNECNFMPLMHVDEPADQTCPTMIGCQDNRRHAENSITALPQALYVLATAIACGNESGRLLYRLTTERGVGYADFAQLAGCGCGDNVRLAIHDCNGDFVRTEIGEIADAWHNYNSMSGGVERAPMLFVELTTALAEGECIKGISCSDVTPTVGVVAFCRDQSTAPELEVDQVQFVLDGIISCEAGDDVTVTYKDAAGATLGTATATIVSVDHDTFTYLVSSVTEDFGCELFPLTASITLTCVP